MSRGGRLVWADSLADGLEIWAGLVGVRGLMAIRLRCSRE